MTSVASSTPWSPPLDVLALQDLLGRLQAWNPLNAADVLAEVAVAVDDWPLSAEQVETAIQRLMPSLKQLTGIAISTGASRSAPYISRLVQQARALQTQQPLEEATAARSYVQRLGWYTGELLEQLIRAGCVKEAV